MTRDYCIGSNYWNGLSKLIEELGELQQVCGKLIGSQGDTLHWSGDLKAMLIEELADVCASLDYFTDMNLTDDEILELKFRRDLKHNLFNKWNKDSQPGLSPGDFVTIDDDKFDSLGVYEIVSIEEVKGSTAVKLELLKDGEVKQVVVAKHQLTKVSE